MKYNKLKKIANIKSGYSVIIPVYNAEKSIEELYIRIVNVFNNLKSDYEIIFIEDCGKDLSWSIIESLALNDKKVRAIQMSRNYGQHNALLCGIRAALNDKIITMDDDLQHLPEEIPKLIEKMNQGFDVIYGIPNIEKHSILRNISSKITKIALSGTMGIENARHTSAFRIFKTKIRDSFSSFNNPTVSIDVLLTWATTKFSFVCVKHEIRQYGKSGYTLRKLIRHALNMFTGFSSRPLQLASLVGFTFSLLGVVILFFVLIRWLINGSTVPGFAFLASMLSIFSGAQLLALGIIGEYLSRMYFGSLGKPSYHISNIIDNEIEN